MPADFRKDDGVGAIGTATGNAYVLLGLSVSALVLLPLLYQRRLW